jgi:hypothetical protein
VRPAAAERPESQSRRPGIDYKWVALSNTTLGVLIATVSATSILIAMPPDSPAPGLTRSW